MIKAKILRLIAENGDYALTAFKTAIPEIEGDEDYIFPAKGISNTNVLLIAGVSNEFHRTINELITTDILTFEPCSELVIIADGGEFYDLPIMTGNMKAYKTLHWLPLLIKKGKKFAEVPFE
jgi:hypothetical protein